MAYPLRGLRHLVAHPATWPLVVLPTLLTWAAFAVAVVVAWWLVPVWMAWVWSPSPQAAPVVLLLYAFVVNLLRALAILTVGGAAYLLAGLVAVPFNDRLSAQVEEVVGGAEALPFRWADVPMSVAHSLLSLGLWVGVVLAAWALEVVPVVGSVAHVVLSVSATGLLLGRELMDGAMSRRRWSFGAKLGFVGRYRGPVLGFGLVAAALLAVPLFNALALPCLVAGGTLLFVDLEGVGAGDAEI